MGKKNATASALAAMTLLLLTACQENPASVYRNYLTRLARTLDAPLPPVFPTVLSPLPRPRELQQDITSGRLDALDFLSLSGCAVQITLGKRNSSLGRMAKDSQRLLLALEYLTLAPDCIDHQRHRGRLDIADTLEQAWRLKRKALPALIFNATLGGEEYRALWRNKSFGPNYSKNVGTTVMTALEAINALSTRWLSGDYRADNVAFELYLSDVATGDGGALLTALSRQHDWLSAASHMVAQRLRKGPVCTPGVRSSAGDILPVVISKYFIGEVQPIAAALARRYHQLLPAVSRQEALLKEALPAKYRQWQHLRSAQLLDFYNAPKHHAEKLKALQAPCHER